MGGGQSEFGWSPSAWMVRMGSFGTDGRLRLDDSFRIICVNLQSADEDRGRRTVGFWMIRMGSFGTDGGLRPG